MPKHTKKFIPFEEQFGPDPNPSVSAPRRMPRDTPVQVRHGSGPRRRGRDVSARVNVGGVTVTPSVTFGNIFEKDAKSTYRLTPTGGGVKVTIPLGGPKKKKKKK